MKKKLLWITLILIGALLAWQIITRINQRKSSESKPGGDRGAAGIAVETAAVSYRDLSDVGSFAGNLVPRSSFLLAPRVAGQLLRLRAEVGQSVSKGQLVAELDDRIFKLELDKAKATVAVARAQAEQAASALSLSELEYDNQRQLYDKGYISRSQFDQANAQLQSDRSRDNVAKATLNSALAALSAAEIQLSYTKVTAQWEGGPATRTIGERLADEGALLASGTPIYRLMDISSLIAEADVVEKDYTRIKAGQAVQVSSDPYPGETFTGKVLRKAPLLAESSRQAKVEIEIPNPSQKLKPGMFARASITFATKQNVQTVPTSALTKFSGQEGVFLVDKSTRVAEFVPLEIGIRGTEYTEVISPELQGEVVVLGQDMLDDGSKVTLPEDAKAGKPQDNRGTR
jgi:RND family efflux transporter MFP subunit